VIGFWKGSEPYKPRCLKRGCCGEDVVGFSYWNFHFKPTVALNAPPSVGLNWRCCLGWPILIPSRYFWLLSGCIIDWFYEFLSIVCSIKLQNYTYVYRWSQCFFSETQILQECGKECPQKPKRAFFLGQALYNCQLLASRISTFDSLTILLAKVVSTSSNQATNQGEIGFSRRVRFHHWLHDLVKYWPGSWLCGGKIRILFLSKRIWMFLYYPTRNHLLFSTEILNLTTLANKMVRL